MRALAAACAVLAAAPPALARDDRAPEWRRIASPADRERLRGWRRAWVAALADARATRDGAAAIAGDALLYDPDRILDHAVPPAGTYRCRTIKLGRRGAVGIGYVAYDWFRCLIGPGPYSTLAKIDGSQRQVGTIYPDTGSRAAFLGTLSLGDERGAMRYRRDPQRDLAGWVERVGDRRWRIVFPYPAFESTLDLLEIAPA